MDETKKITVKRSTQNLTDEYPDILEPREISNTCETPSYDSLTNEIPTSELPTVVTNNTNHLVPNSETETIETTAIINNENKKNNMMRQINGVLLRNLKMRLINYGINIDISTVMKCVIHAMEVVEESNLKGNNKKLMVIILIKTLLDESTINNEKKEIIKTLLNEQLINNTIDLIVDATYLRFDINNAKHLTQTCCWKF